ncbi:sodium:proton antiporter [Massilia sp. BSC265]|uniref:sodium:proton antiporter n=1 Tax=Massilia sp. BSC265 TaxID=1549812 RepID=UPI00068EF511|nr:NADH-quinone oxidoreductase subunit K [Massilia sp. BSC265]
MIEWAIAACVTVVAASGLYLACSRDLVSIAVGIMLLGSAVNLFVFAAGRLGTAAPPLIAAGATGPAAALANPVPQALVLTAVVIGFALACFGVALALALGARDGETDADALGHAEPAPRADGAPGELP